MDVASLGVTWEASEVIRSRLRKEKTLLSHPSSESHCEANRPNAVSNSEVLIPGLVALRNTAGWKLPHLEPLQQEIMTVFEKLGVEVDDSHIYKTSMELKKLLGFVKRRVRRREVTKDSELQIKTL